LLASIHWSSPVVSLTSTVGKTFRHKFQKFASFRVYELLFYFETRKLLNCWNIINSTRVRRNKSLMLVLRRVQKIFIDY